MDIQKIDELFKKAQENKNNPKEYLKYCKAMMREIYKRKEK